MVTDGCDGRKTLDFIVHENSHRDGTSLVDIVWIVMRKKKSYAN